MISVYYPFINKKSVVCRVLPPLWRLIICSKLSKVILKIAHSYQKPLKLLQTKKLAKAGWEEINIYTCFTVPLSFNIGNEKPCSTAFGSFFFTWMVVTLYYRGTLSTSSLLWLYWYFLFLAVFRCLFVLVFIGELPFCIGQTGMS